MPYIIKRFPRWLSARVALLILCLALLPSPGFSKGLLLEGNARVVLVGDSITGLSRNNANGFANIMERAVRKIYPDSHPLIVSLGGSGQPVNGWLALEEQSRTTESTLDVKGIKVKEELDKPADLLVIMLGMNDVLAPYIDESDASLNLWASNYEKLVTNIQQRVHPQHLALASITPCTEDLHSPKNQLIDRMNERIRSIAKKSNALYFPTSERAKEILIMGRQANTDFHITYDFVHPNDAGHLAIATAMLGGMDEPKVSQWLVEQKLNPLLQAAASKNSGISWEKLSVTREPGSKDFVFKIRYHYTSPDSQTNRAVQVVPPSGWKAIPESVQGATGEFKLIGNPDRLSNEFVLRTAHGETCGKIPAPWLLLAGVIESWDGETVDVEKNKTETDAQIIANQNFTVGLKADSKFGWRPYFPSIDFTGLNDPGSVDFAAITHAANFEGGYCARWIYSDKDRPVTINMKSVILAGDVHLWVWMNGATCYQGHITKEPRKTKGVEAQLHRGWNAFVVKSSHRTWLWQFSIGLAAKDGDSLDDLRYSIDYQNPM